MRPCHSTYELFHEDERLRSKAARVEFLNTVRVLEAYLKPGAHILDLGAGREPIVFILPKRAIPWMRWSFLTEMYGISGKSCGRSCR